MMDAAEARSGKSDRDENFPVARLIASRHRPVVMAFYNFVRTGDDIADHPTLQPQEKLDLLNGLAGALTGEAPPQPIAEALRRQLRERGLPPHHALEHLAAFRLDVEKSRTRDFDDLMAYCRLSAMPVGRFMLDVHGESQALWPASDALCAALQIINHLQDCAKDFRDLDRVYLPQDSLERHGASVDMLSAARSCPQLRAVLTDLARRTQDLLRQSKALAAQTRDFRLAMNIAAIQALAEKLTDGLVRRDPLSENTHASKFVFAATSFAAAAKIAARRLLGGGKSF